MTGQLLRLLPSGDFDSCPSCSIPGREVCHMGTVCPVTGIEHSSRGASRDQEVACQVCRRPTLNWSARCGCTVGRLWDSA